MSEITSRSFSPVLNRFLATTLIVLGLALITAVVLSILLQPSPLIDPFTGSSSRFPVIIGSLGLPSHVDYYRPQTWFDPVSLPAAVTSPVKYFSLSIPRLKMLDVSTEVNGQDLKKNAIHLPGTALPGQLGNVVIFGHSSLPHLYKKGYPKTIFNPLPEAKVGDEVVIKFDGVIYRYVIKKVQEVTPDQVDVLTQRYDQSRLTLITCVPLGTYWRRFVATAELMN